MRALDLSIIIPAMNEGKNIRLLMRGIREVVVDLGLAYEILVVDGGSTDDTVAVALQEGAYVLKQKKRGYGGALKEGFKKARGDYILTLDADLSHVPTFIYRMWDQRKEAEVIIASRYVAGGLARMPYGRYFLSLLLNKVYRRVLSLPVCDLSSGFRLYRREALQGLVLESVNFDVLEEILIKLYISGYKIKEIPFVYVPRKEGQSHVRLFSFFLSFFLTLYKMWKLRNSIFACDYDARAFHSTIPLQRYWQRKRHALILEKVFRKKRILDLGCGSSYILRALPRAVGLDVDEKKLLYARCYGHPLVRATIFKLPFKDHVFDALVCSEVIEHVEMRDAIWKEMKRVLKPGGLLVLGTPDYSRVTWLLLEKLYKLFAPGGYADEHISHYTASRLVKLLKAYGFQHLQSDFICSAEAILLFKKSESEQRK